MGNEHHPSLAQPQLERVLETFRAFDGSRILLTGGSGFVGKWMLEIAKIAQQELAIALEFVVPTRQLSAHHVQSAVAIGCPNVSWIEGDFLNETVDVGHIDMIIHAATPASARLNAENPAEMMRINVEAMQSVLRYSNGNTPLLFTSSGAVYGSQHQTKSHIAEGDFEPSPPIEQSSAYAQGKQVAERMCRDAGAGGQCSPIIARLFAFGGEYLPRDTHFAIGNFINGCHGINRQLTVLRHV